MVYNTAGGTDMCINVYFRNRRCYFKLKRK
uniref:Uncharacterized protein n=1 Tax=Anguilla anguilla TaxID=7936 RepID=A0A0E9TGA0_ANGAN